MGANNFSTVQPVVAVERTVFYRERAARMYSALPYALAQVGSVGSVLLFHFIFNPNCPHSNSPWSKVMRNTYFREEHNGILSEPC